MRGFICEEFQINVHGTRNRYVIYSCEFEQSIWRLRQALGAHFDLPKAFRTERDNNSELLKKMSDAEEVGRGLQEKGQGRGEIGKKMV